MPSLTNDPLICRTTEPSGPENYNGGIYGESTLFNGVRGVTYAAGHAAVAGVNDNATGQAGPGVFGISAGAGVAGESSGFNGVRGVSHAEGHGACVGVNDNPTSNAGPGVYGESANGEGVRGVSHSPHHGALVGTNDNPQGIAVYGKGGRLAAFFEGDVEVTGDIRLANADCAEDFNVSGSMTVDPGTVMVIGDTGDVAPCLEAYDTRVAGIISGAGDFKPGIVLDRQASGSHRVPIALMGKVFCKVDAAYGAIATGDLLTTSPSAGHAMRAGNPVSAFGAVIGKALRPHRDGRGLIPVLVALQ